MSQEWILQYQKNPTSSCSSHQKNEYNPTYQDGIPNFKQITDGKLEKSVNRDAIPNCEGITNRKLEKSFRNRRKIYGCVILAGKSFLKITFKMK